MNLKSTCGCRSRVSRNCRRISRASGGKCAAARDDRQPGRVDAYGEDPRRPDARGRAQARLEGCAASPRRRSKTSSRGILSASPRCPLRREETERSRCSFSRRDERDRRRQLSLGPEAEKHHDQCDRHQRGQGRRRTHRSRSSYSGGRRRKSQSPTAYRSSPSARRRRRTSSPARPSSFRPNAATMDALPRASSSSARMASSRRCRPSRSYNGGPANHRRSRSDCRPATARREVRSHRPRLFRGDRRRRERFWQARPARLQDIMLRHGAWSRLRRHRKDARPG